MKKTNLGSRYSFDLLRYSTSNGICFCLKNRCTIVSQACSSDLSIVNVFMEVPVTQWSVLPSKDKFR